MLTPQVTYYRVANKSRISNFYLRHFFDSTGFQNVLKVLAGGGPRSYIGINAQHQLPVVLPPLPEQRAIAEALSDVDGLLGGLERLIAKKRDLKQAAIQQLLTGQTRLPGFHGEWEVKTLGEVLTVRHGKSQHGIAASDGRFPILASGGEIGRTNAFLHDKASVLIGRKGTIDSPQYVDSPFWTVDTLFFTEIKGNAHAKFVFYKFTMISWRSYNEASGVPSLNARTIENIEVLLPPLPEQTAIAAVLSDMDAELAALEERREKTRLLKQGMMQELLTGRTRLV
jgi:type I restriction enzyme S subunit